ncbi:chalcone-flavanone isomerase family protein isoform X2 [Tasmannia lanceolata]
MGSSKTPLSVSKNTSQAKRTPGSGEALLRRQVKTLLQKVEEGTELPKLSLEQFPLPLFQEILNSPKFLAPTPTNTPLIALLSNDDALQTVFPVQEEKTFKIISQAMDDQEQEALDSQEGLVTKVSLFDPTEKSIISDSSVCLSSVLSFESTCRQDKLFEEDDSSAWSIQANKGSQDEEDDEEVEEEGRQVCDEDYEEESQGDDEDTINELCEGLRNMCCLEKKRMPEFLGKHTRFIYNSDDEIEGEEEVAGDSVSPSILRLKGMPTPEGKHLRFLEEEDN